MGTKFFIGFFMGCLVGSLIIAPSVDGIKPPEEEPYLYSVDDQVCLLTFNLNAVISRRHLITHQYNLIVMTPEGRLKNIFNVREKLMAPGRCPEKEGKQ